MGRRRRLNLPACVAIAGVIAVAVCVGGASARQSATKPPPDLSAVLKVGTLTAIPTLDNTKYISINNVALYVYDRLTQLDWLNNVKPMIATSWVGSKDGKTLTMKIRTDVKFNDGTPLTATAVKLSLDRVRTAPSAAAGLLAGITSVDVVNKSTIRVSLKNGGAQLPALFATFSGQIVNPKCLTGGVNLDQPPPQCGSGGLVLDRATPPNQWVLKKAPRPYWDKAAYKFAGLTYNVVPVTQTGINAIQSGDLDLFLTLADGLEQAKALQKQGSVQMQPFGSAALYALLLNPRRAPFNNEALRKAVQAAVDPRAIGLDYFAGNCIPTQQPAQIGGPWYKRGWNPKPYDTARAKQLLTQAGVPDGFSFTITHTAASTNIAIAQIAQSQLGKVGIKVTLNPIASPNDPSVRTGTAQAFVAAWGNVIDPDQNENMLLDFGELRNAPALGSSFQAQIERLRGRASDPRLTAAQRAAVYQQITKIVYDNALIVNVCQLGGAWVHTSKVKNADRAPLTRLIAGSDFRYAYVTK